MRGLGIVRSASAPGKIESWFMRLVAVVALATGLWAHPGASLAQQNPSPALAGSVPQSPPSQEAAGGGAAQQVKAEAARAPDAASRRPVLELFTSQGCSSCPAADALLKRLADRGEVIALSLPVDYWDYLGWKDTLASPKFTERQRAYARTRGDGAIYTPQLVVNGMVHVNGSDEMQIARAVERTEKALPFVAVGLRREHGNLLIEAGGLPHAATGEEATIWFVTIAKSVAVPIERGENQGKTITYYNVVRALTPVGKWSGRPVTIELERAALAGVERCAVLLQQGTSGPILGATLLPEF
jgi:hypothetical protein